MTIILLLIIAALCFAWVRKDIEAKRSHKNLNLVQRLLRREIAEHMDAQQENHRLQGDLDDALFTIELLIKEQTKELRNAHFCLEMVLNGKVPS